MVVRTYTFGVRFHGRMDGGMVARQAGIDRYVHNLLLDAFREEYRMSGLVNTSRAPHQRLVYGAAERFGAAVAAAVDIRRDAPDAARPRPAL